jgi:predicted dehydrogenase
MRKLGIVGCGRITEDAHVPALLELREQAEITALAEPSAERRSAVTALLDGDVTEHEDWNEMYRSGEVDAVVVAVPHHLHLRAIADAAAAGLDVISEKPLANTLTEVDEIGAAIDTAGTRLSMMHNWLYNPDAQAAVAAVAAGRIGDPFLIRNESLAGVRWANRDPSGDWRLDAAKSGGGIVIDAIYHPIYISEAEMQSPVVRVFATTFGATGETPEHTGAVALVHANGGTTTVQRSWASKGGAAGVHEIHGTDGSIRFRPSDPRVLNLIMGGQPPPPPSGPTAPPLEIWEGDAEDWQPLEVEPAPWWKGMESVYAQTFDAWARGEDAPVDLAGARHVLEVVMALYRSAEEGTSVEIKGGPS